MREDSIRYFEELDAIQEDQEAIQEELEAIQEDQEATLATFPLPPTWQRVPRVSRPGKIFLPQHLRTGMKQSAFPTREPTAERIAEYARAAVAFVSGASAGDCTSGSNFRRGGFHGELAQRWRWLGRRVARKARRRWMRSALHCAFSPLSVVLTLRVACCECVRCGLVDQPPFF